jgi:hypothetical protein
MAYTSRVERLKSEQLKKVSEAVYEEANPPVDRHRPLEWRRDFNPVWLPLRNVEIRSNFNVHDRKRDLDRKDDDLPWQRISSEIKTNRFISAVVDGEKFRDSIFCAVIDDKDKGITRLQKPSGEMRLSLRTGEPAEGSGKFPAGVYYGTCFRMNFDSGEDYLCFELYLPESHMNDILERLNSDPDVQLQVGVNLLSFSYEVDAALSHWSHPQYLFI